MSEKVTLELPDNLAQRLRALAAQTQRPFEEVMIESIDRALDDVPVDWLPDDQVLTLCVTQMQEAQQEELSTLLERNRERALPADEQERLHELMRVYRRGLVRKAQALRTAVARGLRPGSNNMVRVYIPVEVARRVRAPARNRCGYCLSPQHLVMARLEVEHIIPRAHGGTDEETNLWLSCPLCNGAKGGRTQGVDPETGQPVLLFNPRSQNWFEHFRWTSDGLRVPLWFPLMHQACILAF